MLLNGVNVGSIEQVSDTDTTKKVRFQVLKDDNDLAKPNNNTNCSWKWITLKVRKDSYREMQQFLNTNYEQIINLNLYISE